MTLNSTSNTTGTSTTTMLSKPLFIQGQEIIQRSFNRLDRVTWTRLSVVFVSLLCLLLMFIGLKSFALRKRRQTRRYKLLSSATRMEEPLFNEHDNEEEEKEDDTLFVRK